MAISLIRVKLRTMLKKANCLEGFRERFFFPPILVIRPNAKHGEIKMKRKAN